MFSGGSPPFPPALALYFRLKRYKGYGNLPFLWSGGFTDQPYMSSLVIERCILAEKTLTDSIIPVASTPTGAINNQESPLTLS